VRKLALFGLLFASFILAVATHATEKATHDEPVSILSNIDFSAKLERLDGIYLSGSLQTYISEAIALTNEPGITIFQQEQVAENLLWDCAYVSDHDCVRMVLEWRLHRTLGEEGAGKCDPGGCRSEVNKLRISKTFLTILVRSIVSLDFGT
jgi:hypothetical protein